MKRKMCNARMVYAIFRRKRLKRERPPLFYLPGGYRNLYSWGFKWRFKVKAKDKKEWIKVLDRCTINRGYGWREVRRGRLAQFLLGEEVLPGSIKLYRIHVKRKKLWVGW